MSVKVGITGGRGFIGWHLHCYLKTLQDVGLIEIAGRSTFDSFEKLCEFVSGKDVIFHLAGVNRADESQLIDGNVEPANKLVEALIFKGESPTVVYSSSTHAESRSTVYGKAKAEVSKIFSDWAGENEGCFQEVVIPHVFGECGKPYYNSATNTFCYQIANGEKPSVTGDGILELIHAQDLSEQLFELGMLGSSGRTRINGCEISVSAVAEKISSMFSDYQLGIVPDFSDDFDRALFNTFRSYLPEDKLKIIPKKHVDDRGWLVETIKVESGGQAFVSTTKPGITRGNHYHRKKFERFFVLQGKASIKLRKLGDKEVREYVVEAESPGFVDIPTLHTHSISNIGDIELITFFWTNEFFDPNKPDTYFELVEK